MGPVRYSDRSAMAVPNDKDRRRRLPAVDQVLQEPEVQALASRFGRAPTLRKLRTLLEQARVLAEAGDEAALDDTLAQLVARLQARVRGAASPSLVRVINATGVVVHTNLGRAPLPRAAAERVAEIAASYTNLEYDQGTGERGHREAHAEGRLLALLAVEAAAVVNNCAAAVLLAVNTLADGREVIVSRGELVEIGGSFRVPEVLKKGGGRLREVGTTNRTRLSDYRAALGPDTGLILRVHPSNFRVVGFTETPNLAELAELARHAGLPLLEDQGSGLLGPVPDLLPAEANVLASVQAGADVVAFSGDKLLGGPQAGLLAGRRAPIAAMRKNPLYRALRVDKMTLAALDAVLLEHESGRAPETLPVLAMLRATPDEVRARAEELVRRLEAANGRYRFALIKGASAVGGGAAPLSEVPTWLIALAHEALSAAAVAAALRAGEPPVIVRVADDRVLIDLRTVRAHEEAALLEGLRRLGGGAPQV
jgi:L-seryl-tRNA(Ser) seleniumtransferase